MKKVFLAISVLFLVMVFTSVQSFSAPAGKGPKPKHISSPLVYDANDQFLGVLIDIGGTQGDPYTKIFIPSLNVATFIRTYTLSGTGYIMGVERVFFEQPYCIYTPNTTYMTTDTPIRIPYVLYEANGRYFYTKTLEEDILIGIASWLDYSGCHEETYGDAETGLKAIEILDEDMPFTLPVALPLRFELKSP